MTPRWDPHQKKVIGNNKIKMYCCTIKSGRQADIEETATIKKSEKEVIKGVNDATGGVSGFFGNVFTFGGVDRAGESAKNAAIEVIHDRVPGVTARVVSSLQWSIPIGIAIMILGVYLANILTLEKDNQNYYYAGVPIGLYICYSPVSIEESSIKSAAEKKAKSAGALLPNLCTVQ